jgi:hypothetical protein
MQIRSGLSGRVFQRMNDIGQDGDPVAVTRIRRGREQCGPHGAAFFRA